MIKLHLIGNCTADAQTTIVNNKQVIEFSICVNQKYKNESGEKLEKKYFFNIKYWNDSTKLAQYITKGQQVYVEGIQITANGYTNSQGSISTSIDVKITSLQLLGAAKNSEITTNDSNAVNGNTEYTHYEPVDDGVPY